jgi:SAM-dependent methyltransferase
MNTQESYILPGGAKGRERLRILSRVMRPSSLALLRRQGVSEGMTCLEIGCGGGDLACDLAELVGDNGRVIATDVDATILELASREAQERGFTNLEFVRSDIISETPVRNVDLVHARFLLTHLPLRDRALKQMYEALRTGGSVILEDIDFRGYFTEPQCPAFWRYVDLHTRAMQAHGGDPFIGPRLPSLLEAAGFEDIEVSIVQPASIRGEVKLMTPLTMENIAPAVESQGLATQSEIAELVEELYRFAQTPGTVGCIPRVVQAWGYKRS